MTDAWAPWYRGLDEPEPYGEVTSYHIAADFLADCEVIHDWGCGKGYFSTLRPDVFGVDGTKTPFSDIVVDLRKFICTVDGILIRHVLEHNYEWEKILDNAVMSATHKLCIILFTPTNDSDTHEIAFTKDIGVPDLSFYLPDIIGPLKEPFSEVIVEEIDSVTQYGHETIIKATV